MTFSIAAVMAAGLTLAAATQSHPEDRDWAQLARTDIEAAHAYIQSHHPGPVDPENPAFVAMMDRNLATSLDLADRAGNAAGYRAALMAYGAQYNDNHLGFLTEMPAGPYAWPEMLLGRRTDGSVFLIWSADRYNLPDGALLAGCDGVAVDDLIRDRVFGFHGVGLREVDWLRRTPQLFLDDGNPFLEPLRVCSFEADGHVRAVELDWQPVTREAWQTQLAVYTGAPESFAAAIREFAPASFWISLPDFNPRGEAAVASVDAVMAEIETRAEDLREAERIVFDMRGNNGGSSAWGHRVARAVWGDDYVGAIRPTLSAVDWRVSPENLAHVRSIIELAASHGHDNGYWIAIAGFIEEGLAEGVDLVRSYGRTRLPLDQRAPADAGEHDLPENPVRADVFFLTMVTSCASACLDFADIVLSAENTRHVGWVTGADSDYMELREIELPSGLSRMGLPIKVYRDRARGSMEAYTPDIPYTGANTSTEALEHWILSLDGQ